MSTSIAIAGVSERDIDLLLLEEFLSSRSFQLWFAEQVLGKNRLLGDLVAAQRSITHTTGESDLEVVFADKSGRKLKLLIENKVNANLQPQQAERYRKRGQSFVREASDATYHTVIVAPARYFGSKLSSKGFDKKITYEAILDWFQQAEEMGDRRYYKTSLLKSAIDKGTLNYQPQEDKPITDFWKSYWRFAKDFASELEMKEPGSKPSRAGFIYFRPDELPAGIEICHKFKKGYVDLQIRGYGNKLNRLRQLMDGQLPQGSEITQTGKSAAVRIYVPVLDPRSSFAEQLPMAQVGLSAAKELLCWCLGNQVLTTGFSPR